MRLINDISRLMYKVAPSWLSAGTFFYVLQTMQTRDRTMPHQEQLWILFVSLACLMVLAGSVGSRGLYVTRLCKETAVQKRNNFWRNAEILGLLCMTIGLLGLCFLSWPAPALVAIGLIATTASRLGALSLALRRGNAEASRNGDSHRLLDTWAKRALMSAWVLLGVFLYTAVVELAAVRRWPLCWPQEGSPFEGLCAGLALAAIAGVALGTGALVSGFVCLLSMAALDSLKRLGAAGR